MAEKQSKGHFPPYFSRTAWQRASGVCLKAGLDVESGIMYQGPHSFCRTGYVEGTSLLCLFCGQDGLHHLASQQPGSWSWREECLASFPLSSFFGSRNMEQKLCSVSAMITVCRNRGRVEQGTWTPFPVCSEPLNHQQPKFAEMFVSTQNAV